MADIEWIDTNPGEGAKMKRLFRYFGSKWMLVNEFLKLFPPHETYVEPFFGSGAVFFNKPLASNSILNDLDSNIWNFFTVIRDNPDQLKAMTDLTPYARDFLKGIFSVGFDKTDKIKWAWEFYCWMNLSRGASTKVCKSNSSLRRSYSQGRFVEDFCSMPNYFKEISAMLKRATIENRCVLKILDDLAKLKEEDKSKIFMFADPPYNPDTRCENHKYGMDFHKENDFEDEFLDKTSKLGVKMMICGYECPKYDEAYKGWNKRQWECQDEAAQKKTETVWFNYDPMEHDEIC